MLRGEGYWENEAVILPKNACVAVLSLLQYLVEDWNGLPEPLVAPVVRLNNLIGAEVHQHGGND